MSEQSRRGGWRPGSGGGPRKGAGRIPNDPAAALDKAIATLSHRLAVCAKLNTMPYAERERVAAAIDRLAAEAEEFVCAALAVEEE